jgi:hypothetical protein
MSGYILLKNVAEMSAAVEYFSQWDKLAVDLEGNFKKGHVDLIQICSQGSPVALFWVKRERRVLEESGLKQLLEASRPMKVLWDVRNDVSILYNSYGIQMRGVLDLQILAVARFNQGKNSLPGLTKGITFLNPVGLNTQTMMAEKKKFKGLFDQDSDMWCRPELEHEDSSQAYAAGDVRYLLQMESAWAFWHSKFWLAKKTEKRWRAFAGLTSIQKLHKKMFIIDFELHELRIARLVILVALLLVLLLAAVALQLQEYNILALVRPFDNLVSEMYSFSIPMFSIDSQHM